MLPKAAAIENAIRSDVEAKNGEALGAALTKIASAAGLSFLTITDAHGRVMARSNGGQVGMQMMSPYIVRALAGETVLAVEDNPALRALLAFSLYYFARKPLDTIDTQEGK